jgi:hypothetical protein
MATVLRIALLAVMRNSISSMRTFVLYDRLWYTMVQEKR